MEKIIIWLIASTLSAWLYRRGGTSKGTLWRDIGCSLIVVVYMVILGLKASWWAYLACFGLSWVALSAYWGLDEQKWGYWAHGLGLSLAALPIAFITGHWLGFGIRSLVLTGLITIWSEYTKWDILEEGGRGFILAATIPLLLI